MSSNAPQNQAAWLTSPKAHPFEVKSAPMPTPKASEVTIAVSAIAINPCDPIIQQTGALLSDEKFPYILGEDIAGTVTQVGADVPTGKYKVGDRVCALADAFDGVSEWVNSNAAFQKYVNVSWTLVAKLPDGVDFKQGTVLPLALATAAECLFRDLPKALGGSGDDDGFAGMGLDMPGVPGTKEEAQIKEKNKGKIVLIWGGSSSVGSCAIQMVKAAGYSIATTASSRNQNFCKGLGADYTFDHTKETVVDDVVNSLKGKGDLVGLMVAVQGDENTEKCAQITRGLDGVKLVGTVQFVKSPKQPDGITTTVASALLTKSDQVGVRIWQEWLSSAMESGIMKCKPDPVVFGNGLETIQSACDHVSKGVSAQKIVIEL